MSSCWATRRASSTSATLQQPVSLSPPHRRIVTPTTSCPSRASSAAATDESTPPLMATITFTRVPPCAGATWPRRRRSPSTASSTSASVVVRPSVRRSAPAAHDAVDAHRGEDVRRVHRPAGARRRGRRADAGLVEQVQQRLALDRPRRGRAPSRRPCRLRRDRLAEARHAGDEPGDEAIAQRGDARRPRCRARRRWPSSATARATMPATLCVPLRRSRSCPPPTMQRRRRPRPRARRARRRPSGRRTCGRSATAGRRAATASRRSSQHAACTASVCTSAPGACSRTTRGDRRQVGDRADLVVDGHHADDGDVVAERVGERVEVDAAGTRRRRTTVPPRRSTVCSTAWCSAAGHTARPPWRRDGADDRRVVGLRAAPREHDLARAGSRSPRRRRRGPRRRPAARRGRSGATRSGWRSAR